MPLASLSFRSVNGEDVQTFSAEELILVLPNGIEVSLYPPDEHEPDIVTLIKAQAGQYQARLIVKPWCRNQIFLSAEHFGSEPFEPLA